MMKRRPHWDDDLLAAVLRYLHDPAPLTDDDRAWNIVEAVEDWQNRKEADRRYAITLGRIGGKYLPEWIAQSAIDRATKAEAVIARVRERAELRFGIPAVQGTYQAGYAAAMDDILRALEGDNE